MEFYEKLQQLRKQKGLTQEELSKALFVSRTAVSKWESGRGYPGIDSLKAISDYFEVSIDELLSGGELLTIASEDQRQKRQYFCDLVFGLLDLSMCMLLFLPFFGQQTESGVIAVPLLSLNDVASYVLVCYFSVVIGMSLLGVTSLTLQNCQLSFWVKNKYRLSLILNAIAVLLFIICPQPNCGIFSFFLMAIKLLILAKR